MHQKYKLLIFSFLLLNIYHWIGTNEIIYGIPKFVKYGLSVFIIGTIIYYKLSNPSKPVPGGLFYPVIVAFISWSLMLLIFEILKFNNVFYIQRVLGQRYFFIPYVLPLFLLYTKFDLEFFSYFFHYAFLFLIPGIIIQVYVILFTISQEFWIEQNILIGTFDLGSVFLLFTAHISKKKYIYYIVLCYFLLWIFMGSFYGRRGMLIENSMFLFIMIIIRLKSSLLEIADRIRIYYSGLILIITFSELWLFIYLNLCFSKRVW